MNTQSLNNIILSFVTLFLSGCFSMTPEYLQPDLGFATPEHYQQAAIKSASTAPVEMEDRWWEVFGDPTLNQWVEDALRNNWDLKQAAARILEIRYQYFEVRADRFPELDIEGGYDRRKTGGGRIDQGVIFSNYNIGFAAAYEIDLWGRLASASEAAWNEILQAEESRQTIAQTVVAETVNLYLQIEALERRIQIAHQSVEAFRRSLKFGRQTGYFKGRRMKAAMDTTYILGRGAVKDTYNLLADGIVHDFRGEVFSRGAVHPFQADPGQFD